MNAIVRRVRKLVALSGSSNDNEARTAAFLACRLIREHALEIDSPAGGRRSGERENGREREAQPEAPRVRVTRGPYTRARLRGEPRCRECGEPIAIDDACLDADERAVHGDCIPAGERP